MVHSNPTAATNELANCMAQKNAPRGFRVGITDNVKRRMQEHGYTGTHCEVECNNDDTARKVEKHFTDPHWWRGKAIKGDDGGGGANSRFVYAYPL